jgi:hypothetical protein
MMAEDRKPWEDLANAIVIQALNDYMAADKARQKRPEDPFIQGKIYVLEKFFRSDWYHVLTDADADYLLAAMRGAGKYRQRLPRKTKG